MFSVTGILLTKELEDLSVHVLEAVQLLPDGLGVAEVNSGAELLV